VKVVGLATSPRRKGNTDLLLSAFLQGAKDAGAETQTLVVPRLEIHPCIGCETCFETGQCQFEDDASRLYGTLLSADLLVLATPVYFYSTSTQAKMLIDRCQALWARRYVLKKQDYVPGGRGVLISTGGSKGKMLFEGLRLTTKYFMDALGKKLSGCLCYAGIDGKKEIEKHPTALTQARTAGKGFVEDFNYTVMEGCTHE